MENIKKKSFGVYNNDSVKTSGQRFFSDLCSKLMDHWIPDEANPSLILFNVSAPLKLIIWAKLKGKKVVVRIDSLYFDRLSPAFIKTFPSPVRPVLRIGLRWKAAHDYLAFLANLFNRNYGVFLRLLIADSVIFQSKFSERIYDNFLLRKKRKVIVNGATYKGQESNQKIKEGINIALIYDQGRPSKRILDIVRFIEWANETKQEEIRLTILGYTGIIPECISNDLISMITTKPYIETYDKFNEYDNEISSILYGSDMYISFSYKDACPNVVVEAMAHGLPVVGLSSGGVPDIVGDAGVLLAFDDFAEGFYSAHRFEDVFPSFSFEEMLGAVKMVKANNALFRQRVQMRFTNELEMDLVANKYARFLNELIK